VLPLGTINVFARELGLPLELKRAWGTIQSGHERVIDLPYAEFRDETGALQQRHFVQLAGAGIDARAVELVDRQLKQRLGFVAYVLAGLRVLRERKPGIRASTDGGAFEAELALIGNGRYYGGTLTVFPQAELSDGLLSVRLIPQANWKFAWQCFKGWIRGRLSEAGPATLLKSSKVTLESSHRVPLQLDGEWVGVLPARFGVRPQALRVAAPKADSATGC
jgi:YegS/Rv2252/BmrU family lipid kinase